MKEIFLLSIFFSFMCLSRPLFAVENAAFEAAFTKCMMGLGDSKYIAATDSEPSKKKEGSGHAGHGEEKPASKVEPAKDPVKETSKETEVKKDDSIKTNPDGTIVY